MMDHDVSLMMMPLNVNIQEAFAYPDLSLLIYLFSLSFSTSVYHSMQWLVICLCIIASGFQVTRVMVYWIRDPGETKLGRTLIVFFPRFMMAFRDCGRYFSLSIKKFNEFNITEIT